MKTLLFTLALTLTTAAMAVCEPNATAGSSNDTKTIIAGSESTGKAAREELSKSQPSIIKDQLGRVMFSESTLVTSAVQSIEIQKDDIYSNARVERYCSETAGLNNAVCVDICAKWTNYLTRP